MKTNVLSVKNCNRMKRQDHRLKRILYERHIKEKIITQSM
jgi:hypothetical protein